MRLRQLFALVSAFLILALVLSASGSRAFGAAVTSSSVDQPIEVSTPLVVTYETSFFASVPLRAPVNVGTDIPGDVSGDTWVDHTDIAFIGDHWLQSGPPTPPGDANADNIVNIFDINFVSANWQPNPIPEPTTLVLLLLAAPGLWWIRRATRR